LAVSIIASTFFTEYGHCAERMMVRPPGYFAARDVSPDLNWGTGDILSKRYTRRSKSGGVESTTENSYISESSISHTGGWKNTR